MTTIPRKMSNNPDTKEVTIYGLGNQLESTLVMSPGYSVYNPIARNACRL